MRSLRNLDERLKYLRNLEERKEQVINSIREQEKLTPELEKRFWRRRRWWQWRIFIFHTDRSGRHGPALRRRRVWSLLPIWFLSPYKDAASERGGALYLREEKGVLTAEEALNGAKGYSGRAYSGDGWSTGHISARPHSRKALSIHLPVTGTRNLSTRCIITLRSR